MSDPYWHLAGVMKMRSLLLLESCLYRGAAILQNFVTQLLRLADMCLVARRGLREGDITGPDLSSDEVG